LQHQRNLISSQIENWERLLFSVYAIENDFLLPQRVLIVLDIDLMVVLAVRGRVEVLQIP
jgi:hypothetical protein